MTDEPIAPAPEDTKTKIEDAAKASAAATGNALESGAKAAVVWAETHTTMVLSGGVGFVLGLVLGYLVHG